MLKEDFIKDLADFNISDDEIVEKYILFGTPYIFADNENLYYDLKSDVTNFFSIGRLGVRRML